LWVCNRSVEGEGYKWMYEKSYIRTTEKQINYLSIKQLWN